MNIENALLSVYYKEGIVDMARILHESGVTLISTGGTQRTIAAAGIPVEGVEHYTNWPEMLDDRVKTLHPVVHGGILYIRGNDTHEETVSEYKIPNIGLVVVNLYPVDEAIPSGDINKIVKLTDIGGPTMLRSAAKNHDFVGAVCDPKDYLPVAELIRDNNGELPAEAREELALKVFKLTSEYDAKIVSARENIIAGRGGPKYFGD